MDKSEERALVQKLTRMDDGAWRLFCEQFSAPLLESVRLHFGCTLQEAEEITQMAFVRCVKSIGTFDASRGRLFQWLKAVAKNEGHRRFRTTRRHRTDTLLSAIPADVLEQIADGIDRRPLPEELLAARELRLLIHECLMEVNSRYREALLAKYVDEMSMGEIAARWDTSQKAVESLLTRARESFRNALLAKIAKERATTPELSQ